PRNRRSRRDHHRRREYPGLYPDHDNRDCSRDEQRRPAAGSWSWDRSHRSFDDGQRGQPVSWARSGRSQVAFAASFGQEMLREQILDRLTYIKGPFRDLVRSMRILIVTVACFVAAFIAGTAPVRAQALPAYDVDAETAKCVSQAETGNQWADALKGWCRSIGKDEHLAHDQLA